jgi:hypothetical protein
MLGMILVGATACQQDEGMVIGAEAVEGCQLSLDNLGGSEWVLLSVAPDKTESADHSARLKFYNEDGGLKAKYNAKSVGDMYTYECRTRGEGLFCAEPAKVKDWCQALETGDGTCDAANLRKIDDAITDAQIEEGMAEARKVIDQYKGGKDWEQFVFNNNNLGNKLQGRIHVSLDSRNCRLTINDLYMTIYNGKKREDSNPIGRSSFVANEAGQELLWEHCDDGLNLVDIEDAEYPKDLGKVQPKTRWGVGETVNYWYLGEDLRNVEEGCSYSYDTWLDGKPLSKGNTPEIVDARKGKELRWHLSQAYSEVSVPNVTPAVMMVMNKKCEGKDPVKKTACRLILVQ